ncbi:hypothetical protein K432DRAFT_42003 [Lepidopterella palustris CBS 459.81]|uniref:Uncharacterized protein n=1 Tax=Lepidopterella palustris CBS 459.81 TaxID=1314670 RepID=A0A8E2EB02_9PEZI|nr:hypothetical protein K432DRAFT_42003 [Lepidopterella palustris CBS 459.81]
MHAYMKNLLLFWRRRICGNAGVVAYILEQAWRLLLGYLDIFLFFFLPFFIFNFSLALPTSVAWAVHCASQCPFPLFVHTGGSCIGWCVRILVYFIIFELYVWRRSSVYFVNILPVLVPGWACS